MPLIDSLANLIGEVATDIRRHVVEEPWFGRAVTDTRENAVEGDWFDRTTLEVHKRVEEEVYFGRAVIQEGTFDGMVAANYGKQIDAPEQPGHAREPDIDR
jgi:hypothetical protein